MSTILSTCGRCIFLMFTLRAAALSLVLPDHRYLERMNSMARIHLTVAGLWISLWYLNIGNSCDEFILRTMKCGIVQWLRSIFHISKKAFTQLELLKSIEGDRGEIRVSMWRLFCIWLRMSWLWGGHRVRLVDVLEVTFEIRKAFVLCSPRRTFRRDHGY